MSRLSISTWTLHGLLQSGLALVDVPVQIADCGIRTLEVCHFHLPSVEAAYLAEMRESIRESGVELYSILIDSGDITVPEEAALQADLRMIEGWIEVAAALGAERVRIDAGKQPPTPEVVRKSADNLRRLTQYAEERGVKVSTENWHATSAQPGPLLEILDLCEGRIGLCADTGNAEGPGKYETLSLLLPRATSMHFKARYDGNGSIQQDDLSRCLELMEASCFDGPISLIYNETDNEWVAVEQLKAAIAPHIVSAAV